MAHKQKKKKAPQPAAASGQNARPGPRPPKSMVIRLHASAVGPSITQLTADFRRLMSPDTASRLRERRANKLKDYIAMTGPLGVTHLFLFSRSKNGNVHLRVCLAPRGPTLTFRVEGYSLAKDVEKGMKRPRGGDLGVWAKAPLVVMNNFAQSKSKTSEADTQEQDPIHKQLETLMTTVFQGIFPAITPSSTRVDSIKRILLLNRETPNASKRSKSNSKSDNENSQPGLFTISLRHYAITTRQSGVSKRVRRFDASEQRKREQHTKSQHSGALPNLGRLEDAADYLLDPSAAGYTSASDTELDSENEVEVLETETQRVLSRKQRQKLQEQRQRQQDAQKATVDDEEDADADADVATTTQSKQSNQQQQQHQPKQHLEKRAIKLVELGPRMRLRLVKVEEGICDGKVMWNEFVDKSKEEVDELEGRWKARRQEKEERKRVQRENVLRKRGEKQKKTNVKGAGADGDDDDDEEEGGEDGIEYGSDFDVEDFDVEDFDDMDAEVADADADADEEEEEDDDQMED